MNATNTIAAFQRELFFKATDIAAHRAMRIRRVVRAVTIYVALVTIAWAIFLALFTDYRLVIFGNILLIVMFAISASLINTNKLNAARHVLVVSTILYILYTAFVASGNGGPHGGPIHYWLIGLIVLTQFVFDPKDKWRHIYNISCLILFVLIEYSIVPLHPIELWSHTQLEWAHFITVTTVILCIILGTELFITDITEAENRLRESNDKLEQLLMNMLPISIATRLQEEGRTFAEAFSECSILFADLVGFTPLSEKRSPQELVSLLNDIFSRFDQLTEEAGLEKIKTIGDAYMVAAGVPESRKDHAEALVRLAHKMLKVIADYDGLKVRIGINSGTVVAGVIGKKRFIYDLWGDAVNVAARMESHGLPGAIQITESTRALLGETFEVKERGEMEIKGKGKMKTYIVLEERVPPAQKA